MTYIDPENEPHAVFCFRYRPRGKLLPSGLPSIFSLTIHADILEAQGIIPAQSRLLLQAPPSPSTREHSAPVKEETDMGEEEKLDGEVIDLRDREPSPIRVPETMRGVVIDLTDD